MRYHNNLYQNIKIFIHSLKLFACLLCLCVPSHKVTFSCYASLMPPVMSNILIYVIYLCVVQFFTLIFENISALCRGCAIRKKRTCQILNVQQYYRPIYETWIMNWNIKTSTTRTTLYWWGRPKSIFKRAKDWNVIGQNQYKTPN